MGTVEILGELIEGQQGGFDLVHDEDGQAAAVPLNRGLGPQRAGWVLRRQTEQSVRPSLHRKAQALQLGCDGKRDLGPVALPRRLLETAMDTAALQRPFHASQAVVDASAPQQKLH